MDYVRRSTALKGLMRREAEIGPHEVIRELLASWHDGRIKLYLLYRCLNYRRNNRATFEQGDYLPLEIHGARSRHVCAFSRQVEGKGIIAVAARFFATLAPERGMLPVGYPVWLDTTVQLPGAASLSYRNIVTGETIQAGETGGTPSISLAQLFSVAPVALLEW